MTDDLTLQRVLTAAVAVLDEEEEAERAYADLLIGLQVEGITSSDPDETARLFCLWKLARRIGTHMNQDGRVRPFR